MAGMGSAADQLNDMVVVVDDDEAVGDSVVFLLETAGYRAKAFRSAIAFLADREVRPACLIVDHEMPGMTGLQLAERLHREGAKTPVLLTASWARSGISRSAARIGVHAVLIKPFEPDDLLRFVETHLTRDG